MKRLVFLLIVSVISVFLVTGCAQPNDPDENVDVTYLELVNIYETEAYVEDFEVTDDHIYIAEDMAGFSIWDNMSGDLMYRSDTLSITSAKQIEVLEENDFMMIYNQYGTGAGVYFYDISTIDNPQQVHLHTGNQNNIEQIETWSIENNRFRFSWIYNGSDYYTGEWIWQTFPGWYQDINTFEGHTFDFGFNNFDEDLDNKRLYCSAGELGAKIIDRDDFSVISSISTIGQTITVKVVDNVAFLGNREEGIQLFDISDEMNPVEIYNYDTTGLASDVAVSSELNVFAFASTSGGIYLFRGPDGEIERLQRIDDSEIGYTYSVKISGNYLYAGTRYGVYKFEIKNLR